MTTPPSKGYTLVVYKGSGKPEHFHLKPGPEEIDSKQEHLLTLMPLAHGGVYRHSHGPGFGSITLSGTFGYKRRSVDGKSYTGQELFEKFRKLIWIDYLKALRSATASEQAKIKIQLHSWDENEHWYVEPEEFEVPKSPDNRTFYRYRVTFRQYARIERKPKVRVARSRASGPGRPANTPSQILDFFRKAKARLDQTAASVRAAARQIEGYNDFVLRGLDQVTSSVDEIVREVERLVEEVTDLLSLPLTVLTRAIDSISQWIETGGRIAHASITTFNRRLRNLRRAIQRLLNAPGLVADQTSQAALAFGSEVADTFGASTDSEFDAQTQTQALSLRTTYQGARPVLIRQGDTLRSLAQEHMGARNQWKLLATYNQLSPPYLSENGARGTLKIGDRLWIPTTQGQGQQLPSLARTNTVQRRSDDRLYGRELLAHWRKGKVSVALRDNDIVTVGGQPNLIQAILLKLSIRQGELPADTDYGSRNFVGQAASEGNALLVKWIAEEVCESDPRIRRATASVDEEGPTTSLHLDLEPIDGAQFSLNTTL